MASVSNAYNSYVLNGAYTSLYKTSNPKTSNTQDDVFISLQGNNKEQTNLSDNEILEKIRNQTRITQQAWRTSIFYNVNDKDILINGVIEKIDKDYRKKYPNVETIISSGSFFLQDKSFINKIDTKLQEKATKKVTLKEAEEAQEFLNKQMDSIMLELYKKNPKLMEDTMKKEYDFYTNGGFSGDYKPSKEIANLQSDERIERLLIDYGIRTEGEELDKSFEKFLAKMRENFQGENIDEELILELRQGVGIYRYQKMEMSGYAFFSQVTDMLSKEEQEKITDAIVDVLSFYSGANSIELNGTKVSWEPESKDPNSVYGWGSNVTMDVACIDVKIEYGTNNDDLLLPLNAKYSNFDSTQSFFDMLEQREKLEKENQELQNKRGLNLVNNPYIETKSDGILKEVLKSKDKEIRA
ncbi:hypothetical protein B6S12_01210 [Helicobacter valdiviensis]|uniref:Uncharacterized protein n=1 Tax=Helicobacter valdiviensis TaxID=1458358 RepID=A0A2W6MX79_9HELI|nr:hypothetical protein [Helicobacter valdiviensis]PZT48942.1 hypothetical protein B6S12_01210 [Helicobacter valdiviensis]